jgi:hypothetical protein
MTDFYLAQNFTNLIRKQTSGTRPEHEAGEAATIRPVGLGVLPESSASPQLPFVEMSTTQTTQHDFQ